MRIDISVNTWYEKEFRVGDLVYLDLPNKPRSVVKILSRQFDAIKKPSVFTIELLPVDQEDVLNEI